MTNWESIVPKWKYLICKIDLSKLASNEEVACRLVEGVCCLVIANFDGVPGTWRYWDRMWRFLLLSCLSCPSWLQFDSSWNVLYLGLFGYWCCWNRLGEWLLKYGWWTLDVPFRKIMGHKPLWTKWTAKKLCGIKWIWNKIKTYLCSKELRLNLNFD